MKTERSNFSQKSTRVILGTKAGATQVMCGADCVEFGTDAGSTGLRCSKSPANPSKLFWMTILGVAGAF
jgi:hypothetical protein